MQCADLCEAAKHVVCHMCAGPAPGYAAFGGMQPVNGVQQASGEVAPANGFNSIGGTELDALCDVAPADMFKPNGLHTLANVSVRPRSELAIHPLFNRSVCHHGCLWYLWHATSGFQF